MDMKKFLKNKKKEDANEFDASTQRQGKVGVKSIDTHKNLNRLIVIIEVVVIIFLVGYLLKRWYFNEFYYKIPNFVGVNYEKVKKDIGSNKVRLKNMGEVFSDEAYGSIAIQDPKPGSVVKRNRNIKVWVSKSQKASYVPNLINLNILEAESIAKQLGLEVGRVTKVRSNYGINRVVGTSIKTDEPINRGETINFIISLGY